MAAGENVIIMRGPSCDRKKATKHEWCAGWAELVARRLVTSTVGCTSTASGESWCIGRVATDSACSAKLPLLPSLPVHRRRDAKGESPPDVLTPLQPTRMHPRPRMASAYESDGWRSEEVSGLRLGYWWRYFTVWQGCDGPLSSSSGSGRGRRRASNASLAVAPSAPAASTTASSSSNVCMIFKNHIFESWVGGVGSSDHGRSFEAEPSLVMPATWLTARMTHNLALAPILDGGNATVLLRSTYSSAGSLSSRARLDAAVAAGIVYRAGPTFQSIMVCGWQRARRGGTCLARRIR